MLAASVLIGLLGLIRFDLLPLSLFMFLYGFWCQKWRFWYLLTGLLIIFLLVFPHHWSTYKTFNDPFYYSRAQVRAWANYEFAGQPGFPSKEEIARDLFTGSPISLSEYLFRYHSLPEILERLAVGSFLLIGGLIASTFSVSHVLEIPTASVLIAVVAGWAAALSGRYRFLPLIIIVGALNYAFFVQIHLEYRIVIFLYPLLGYSFCLGFYRLAQKAAGPDTGSLKPQGQGHV